MVLTIRPDCKYFTGWKPCRHGECQTCDSHTPARPRILIVKLAAGGDVVRSTSLLPRLRAEHPNGHITWVVDPVNAELLDNSPFLDRVLPMSGALSVLFAVEEFDIAFGLEHKPVGAALVTLCRAGIKRGLLLSPQGKPVPADSRAEYWYRLGLSNELKFRHNRKTYQEYMFEACGYDFRGERYALQFTDDERDAALKSWDLCSLTRPTVGINLGGSAKFAGRQWPDSHVLELARVLRSRDRDVLLLAGDSERERAYRLAARCPDLKVSPLRSKRVLAALIERLAVLVTGDTLALYLATAVGTPTVALFGGTSWHEFETYSLAQKLTAELPCSPCYRPDCESQDCMTALSPEQVVGAIERAS